MLCVGVFVFSTGASIAFAQQQPAVAASDPDVQATKAWIACAATHAVQYASQPGEVGDLADAALGACDDQYNTMVRVRQDADEKSGVAADDPVDFIARVQHQEVQTTAHQRAELRLRLISVIVETRMRRTPPLPVQ